MRFVNDSRTPISRAFRATHRTGYRSIRGLQDTHPDGSIIQMADMIAGEFRLCGGLSGDYLPMIRSRAHIV